MLYYASSSIIVRHQSRTIKLKLFAELFDRSLIVAPVVAVLNLVVLLYNLVVEYCQVIITSLHAACHLH